MREWIYVYGWKGSNYPLGYDATEEEVAEIAAANPRWIFFLSTNLDP